MAKQLICTCRPFYDDDGNFTETYMYILECEDKGIAILGPTTVEDCNPVISLIMLAPTLENPDFNPIKGELIDNEKLNALYLEDKWKSLVDASDLCDKVLNLVNKVSVSE